MTLATLIRTRRLIDLTVTDRGRFPRRLTGLPKVSPMPESKVDPSWEYRLPERYRRP